MAEDEEVATRWLVARWDGVEFVCAEAFDGISSPAAADDRPSSYINDSVVPILPSRDQFVVAEFERLLKDFSHLLTCRWRFEANVGWEGDQELPSSMKQES